MYLNPLISIYYQDFKLTIRGEYVNQFGEKGSLFSLIPLFILECNRVYSAENEYYIHQTPAMQAEEEWAYGFLPFAGLGGTSTQKQVLLLVKDYHSMSPSVYADLNSNLNLRDDGEAYSLEDSSFLVHLKNSRYPQSKLST